MPAWLYQMTTKKIDGEPWNPEKYRLQVWEGKNITWGTHKIIGQDTTITPGGLIILVFTIARTEDYGIYGWGIISKYNATSKKITFAPTFPSNYLKVSPAWDKTVDALMRRIRVPAPRFGTMWAMTLDDLKIIRGAIRSHLGRTSV